MKDKIALFKGLFFMPIFLLYYYALAGAKAKNIISVDFRRFCDWQGRPYSMMGFCKLFAQLNEFRTICYKRLGARRLLISWLWKGQTNLSLACNDIGPSMDTVQ